MHIVGTVQEAWYRFSDKFGHSPHLTDIRHQNGKKCRTPDPHRVDRMPNAWTLTKLLSFSKIFSLSHLGTIRMQKMQFLRKILPLSVINTVNNQ